MIMAARSRPVHAHLGIDNDTPWSIVVTDTPALLPLLRVVRSHSPG